jgi:hypothetical protein
MNRASVVPNEIVVQHSVRAEVGREFLSVECPAGWDDVKKLVKKVLLFDGRKFAYCSWNSDLNVANFVRLLDGSSPSPTIAKIL